MKIFLSTTINLVALFQESSRYQSGQTKRIHSGRILVLRRVRSDVPHRAVDLQEVMGRGAFAHKIRELRVCGYLQKMHRSARSALRLGLRKMRVREARK